MMVDNLAIFIFKESQNVTFSFRDTFILLGITTAVTGISVINFDHRKLNSIILLPLPVFHIRIVRLSEGYL